MFINLSQQIRDHLAQQPGDPFDNTSVVCTTVEGNRKHSGDRFWLQIHAGEINFQHLTQQGKEEILSDIISELGNPVEISVEEGLYITFSVSSIGEAFQNNLFNLLLKDYYEMDLVSGLEFVTADL